MFSTKADSCPHRPGRGVLGDATDPVVPSYGPGKWEVVARSVEDPGALHEKLGNVLLDRKCYNRL